MLPSAKRRGRERHSGGPDDVSPRTARQSLVTLAVVGNINVDLLVWPVVEIPPPGAERSVERVELRVGGSSAISGAVLARLGAEPIVCGCVGTDALGAMALEELDRYGVDTRHVCRIPGASTGTSIAFEGPGRDRSFLISLGSLSTYGPSLVPEEVFGSSFVLLCGYFNLPLMRGAAAAAILRRVKEAGGTTLLDIGWDHDGWSEATRRESQRLLPYVDIFIPNEMEAQGLSGKSDPLAAARGLADLSGGWTVVKLGSSGAVAAGPDGAVYRASAPRVDVVDTTGAGDAFNAGLIDALSRGASWPEVLRAACAVASTVVSRPSANRYPTRAELLVLE